jgi:DNA-binding FadR family transcriptional regulator
VANGERRGPAHVTLARTLGIAIVTGDYPSGTVLPGELELAGQFGVSRSVIRESLRMLSAKGLVESRPKAGTRVRERAQWNLLDPELLAWMFEGAPSLGFVRSLFQLRMIVEPAAAELAAVQRSAAQLSRMGHAVEVMAQQGLRTQDGQTADQRFHAAILEATGNELLVSLSSSIAAAVRWTTFFKYRVPLQYRDPIPLHRELFEAIANGDAGAARGVTERLIAQAGLDTERALGA